VILLINVMILFFREGECYGRLNLSVFGILICVLYGSRGFCAGYWWADVSLFLVVHMFLVVCLVLRGVGYSVSVRTTFRLYQYRIKKKEFYKVLPDPCQIVPYETYYVV